MIIYDLYVTHGENMPKSVTRTYSRYTHDAVQLMAGLIRASRIEQKLTAQEVAERAGISRSMLQRIEKGDLKCEIGAVFEIAAILGIPLFNADEKGLSQHIDRTKEKLALLPKAVRKKTTEVDDDF